MPSSNIGSVHVYPWNPDHGEELPQAGTLFETTGGTGYLVAHARWSRGSGHALGRMRLTVVVVDLNDPDLADLPRWTWHWGSEAAQLYAETHHQLNSITTN